MALVAALALGAADARGCRCRRGRRGLAHEQVDIPDHDGPFNFDIYGQRFSLVGVLGSGPNWTCYE